MRFETKAFYYSDEFHDKNILHNVTYLRPGVHSTTVNRDITERVHSTDTYEIFIPNFLSAF
jgi:hypothetical protein